MVAHGLWLPCTGFLSLPAARAALQYQWAYASRSSGFCCCRAQALEPMGSVVAAYGFSCPACGIFLDQGLNSCPLIGRWILNHWTTREVPQVCVCVCVCV